MSIQPHQDPKLPPALRHVMAHHGTSLLNDPGQLQMLLQTERAGAEPAIALVIQALQLGLPQHLMESAATESADAAIARLAPWLSESLPCPLADAIWLVQCWRHGLGLDLRPTAPPAVGRVAVQGAASTALRHPAAQRLVAQNSPAVDATPVSPRKGPKPWLLATGGALATCALGGLYYAFVFSSIQVLDVQPRAALVSNGKPQEVMLQYAARNASLKQIDVRLVRGQSTGPTSFSVPVAQATLDRGELPAGTLASRSTVPQQLTYEYRLVTRDGKVSAPLEKTFDMTPPTVITKVTGPGNVRPGQPFTVALHYQRGSSDIVKVLSKVVESDAPWPVPEQSLAVALNQTSGRQDFRLEAPSQARNSTLEFTMVDAAGISSEPVRLAVATTAAAVVTGQPGTVQSVARVGGAVGLGAVAGAGVGGAIGNRFGRGSGRTAMTLLGAAGGAIVGHQVESNVRGGEGWETSVRLDSGTVARIRHSEAPRWQVGSRVRVVGNSIRL